MLGVGAGAQDIRLEVDGQHCQPTTQMGKMSVGWGGCPFLWASLVPLTPGHRQALEEKVMDDDQMEHFCSLLYPSV